MEFDADVFDFSRGVEERVVHFFVEDDVGAEIKAVEIDHIDPASSSLAARNLATSKSASSFFMLVIAVLER